MPLATDNIGIDVARFISHGNELQQNLGLTSTDSDQHVARNTFMHSVFYPEE